MGDDGGGTVAEGVGLIWGVCEDFSWMDGCLDLKINVMSYIVIAPCTLLLLVNRQFIS